MKIKELDELIKLLKKFKKEPDYEEFDEDLITDDLINIIEIYKDFLGYDDFETKPMMYQSNRIQEVLANGKYKDYQFYILNLGTHPTAYVEIPINNKLYGKNYNDIDICCHYGLTYSKNYLNLIKDNSWFIGWDYAHCDDYTGYEMNFPESIRTGGKKWTTEEILQEVFDVINQIIKINEEESDINENKNA